MVGKTGKDAARLKEELAELRRRKAELESTQNVYKRLAEELRHGEDLFRSMADTANDAILVLDEQGTVIYINRTGERLFGQSADEVIGRRLHETLTPERFRDYSSKSFAAHSATGMEGMLGTVREFQALSRDGKEFPVEVSISAIVSAERTYYMTFCRDITERKRAEEELRESQQRYRNLVENLNDMVFTLDPLGRFSYTSPSIEQITGYKADEVLGEPFTRIAHPDDVPGLLASLERTLEGQQEPLEFRVIDKDGEQIHVRMSSRPLLRNGDLIGTTGVMADISRRKQAEEELARHRDHLEELVDERTRELEEAAEGLRRSETYYRSLIRSAPDMIDILNEDLTIRWGSTTAGRITGYTPDEIYGKSILDYVHPDDIPASRELLDQVLANPGKPQGIMVRFMHKDGSYHYHEAIATNLLQDAAVKGIVLNSRDITDRMQLDEELRRSEKYFRALIENAYDIIAVLNEDGTMGYLSPSLERISGFKQEERLGEDAFQFFHPDDLPRVVEAFARGLQTPGHTDVVEYRWQHKDGSWHWQEAIATNLLEDPAVSGIVVNARDITERKEAELALRESEERYRSLVETSPDSIILTDLQGKILMINRSGVALYGYKDEEEIVGKHLLDFFAPQERTRISEIMGDKSYAEQRTTKGEYIMLRKDGTRFYGEVVASLVRDGEGEPVGFLGISGDITDRRIAEQALRESEERYRSLVETSPDCIVLTDLGGSILMVNQSGVDLFRYGSAEEMLGRSVFKLIAPEDGPRALRSMRTKPEEDTTRNEEYLLIRKDGTRFFGEIAASLLRDLDGRPAGFTSITRDITDRKRAEERLVRLNECFLSLGTDPLENIQRFVLTGKDILDADMVRYGRTEKGKFLVFSSLHPDKGFRPLEEVDDYLCYHLMSTGASGPVTSSDVDANVMERDPDVRAHGFRSFLFFPIRVQGENTGCFNMLDVEEKQYTQIEMDTMALLGRAIGIEEERYGFNESLRDFVDIASHELRHPVALLAGFTETLESHGAEMDELTRQEVVDAIRQSTMRISTMVEGLLKVSLTERERFTLIKRPADLGPLLERVLREMRQKLPQRTFSLTVPDEKMECEADLERIHDLLVILLDNAVKYSPEASEVTLAGEVAGEEIIVSVLDRGIGVPAEHSDKVFERFYQVEEAQYHSTPGLGLGLFLARQVVEAHGGRIWHEHREGGGSAFRFTLPLS